MADEKIKIDPIRSRELFDAVHSQLDMSKEKYGEFETMLSDRKSAEMVHTRLNEMYGGQLLDFDQFWGQLKKKEDITDWQQGLPPGVKLLPQAIKSGQPDSFTSVLADIRPVSTDPAVQKELSSAIAADSPVPDGKIESGKGEKERGYFKDILDSFAGGIASTSQGIAQAPGFILEVLATPQNLLADALNAEWLKTDLPERLKDNALANRFKQDAEVLRQRTDRYDKTITAYIKSGQIGKAAGSMGIQIAETIPYMIGIAAGAMSGATPIQLIGGIGSVAGAQRREELDDKDLSEYMKTLNSALYGLAEGAFEFAGTAQVVTLAKDLVKKIGSNQAKEAVRKGFAASVYKSVKNLPATAAITEGIEEGATQYSQNVIDIVTGVDKNKNPMDGVWDAMIVGGGAGFLFGGFGSAAKTIEEKEARLKEKTIADKINSAGPPPVPPINTDQNVQVEEKAAETAATAEIIPEAAAEEVGKEKVKTPEELKAEAEARILKIKEDGAELDSKMAEAQKRLELPETPDISVSDETEITLDKLDNNEPVTNEFLQSAQDELYGHYKELERMKESDTRLYTIEQIEAMQEFIGEEITKLDEYAKQQKETGQFIDEAKASEATQERKREVDARIAEIDQRKSEIDKQMLSADEVTKKTLSEEFISLNKERAKLVSGEITSIQNQDEKAEVQRQGPAKVAEPSAGESGAVEAAPIITAPVSMTTTTPKKLTKGGITRVVNNIKSGKVKIEDVIARLTKQGFEVPQEIIDLQNDSKNTQGMAGEKRVGPQPVQAKPNQDPGPQEAGGSGVVQETQKIESISDDDLFSQIKDLAKRHTEIHDRVVYLSMTNSNFKKDPEYIKLIEEASQIDSQLKTLFDEHKRRNEAGKTGKPVPGVQEGKTGVPAETTQTGEARPQIADVVRGAVYSSVEDKASEIDPLTIPESDLNEEVRYRTTARNIEVSDEDVQDMSTIARAAMSDHAGTVSRAIDDVVNKFVAKKKAGKNPPVKSPAVNTKADGSASTTPSVTYDDAVESKKKDKTKNLWIRQGSSKSNKGRILLVQFSSDLLNGGRRKGASPSERYYDKLYRTRRGYKRTFDFWEVPLWIARIAGIAPNSDVYVIRNIEEAKKFIKEAGYDNIAFSALDINEKYISEIADAIPGQKFSVGGYTNFDNLKKKKNISIYDSVEQFAFKNGLKDTGTYSYRHFAGTQVIPRLKMSQGCKHTCAFCTVPKEVIPMSKQSIDAQVESIRDLDARLVYLDDKTFGQADNFSYLTEVYHAIKQFNPDFEGFIIQTTSTQMKKFTPEFLRDSHIKFVELGVETYNDNILREIKKMHSSKVNTDAAVQKIREAGINFIPNVIVGFKQETAETYAKTAQFLRDNMDIISHINVYNLALYQGTELADTIEAKAESDMNENLVAKSFHSNPAVHEAAMEEFTKIASEALDNTLYSDKSKKEVAPGYAEKNKLVTTDRMEELRKKLKGKMGQLSSGIDPETMAILAEMAVFHIEAGARQFAEFSKRMVEEAGELVKPVLKKLFDDANNKLVGEKPIGEKERKTSRTMREYGTDGARKIANENPQFYTPQRFGDAVEEAISMVDSAGGPEASLPLVLESPKTEDFDKIQVARMILMNYYGRIISSPDATIEEVNRAGVAMEQLQQAAGRDNEFAGRSIAFWGQCKSMDPNAAFNFMKWKIDRHKKEILSKGTSGKTAQDQIRALTEEVNKISKELGAEILKNKELQDLIKKVSGSVQTRAFREKADREKTTRKQITDKFKKSGAGLTLTSGGFTKEGLEYLGEMAASYIRQGVYEIADLMSRISAQVKSDLGQDVSAQKIQEAIGTQAKELIANTISKGATSENINSIINQHWDDRAKNTEKLAKKLVKEAGISENEASDIQRLVDKIIDDKVRQKSEEAVDKAIAPKKRSKPVRKTVVDRMSDMIKRGMMDNAKFEGLFAEFFGMKEMTKEDEARLKELIGVVNSVEGYGYISNRAMIDLARFVTEFIPQTRSEVFFRRFIEIAYFNMLSGISTHALNMFSTGTNFVSIPFKAFTNLSRWKSFLTQKGDITANPIADLWYEMSAMMKGIELGKKSFMDVLKNGSADSKYIEDIVGKEKLKVSEYERSSIKGPGRLIKFTSRMLAAEDKLMWNTAYEMQIMMIIRDKLYKEGLRGEKLRKAVIDEYMGTHVDMDAVMEKLEEEVSRYEKGGGRLNENQKSIRLRELIVEGFTTADEREVANQMAKSTIFTDDRYGVVARVAALIGRVANNSVSSKLAVMPFIPFTKVVGNVAEYMLDHTPFLGMMRVNGLSITGMLKKFGVVENSSQMGPIGSRQYYEQMSRAWFGTIAFSLIAAMFLGRDDEDFVEITGSQAGQPEGAMNAKPKYSFRVGKTWVTYLNIPSLAVPMAIVGNASDRIKDGERVEDVMDVTRLALLSSSDALFMVRDMSVMEGVANLATMIKDAAVANAEASDAQKGAAIEKAVKGFTKNYLSFATRPLPWNNNMIRQIYKIYDPTSYSQKEISNILAYSMGLTYFPKLGEKMGLPVEERLDVFGESVKTYPAETMIPYTHWAGIKGKDERWKFLYDHNAIPAAIKNDKMVTIRGVEERYLEADEYKELVKDAGAIFSEKLLKYMQKSPESIEKRAETKVGYLGKEETKVQKDISKLWEDSKGEARDRFRRKYNKTEQAKEKRAEFRSRNQ